MNNNTMDSPLSFIQLSSELASFAKNDCKAVKQEGGILRNNVLKQEQKKAFPNNLRSFLQIIPGNDICPDCSLRKSWKNFDSIEAAKEGNLRWANVEYGTIICEECAGQHIKMNKMTSAIKSFEDSHWTLPQVISIIEGGNTNFLNQVDQNKRSSRDPSPKRSSSRVLMRRSSRSKRSVVSFDDEVIQESLIDASPSSSFESRYMENFHAERYKTEHSSRVSDLCRFHGGNDALSRCHQSIIAECDFNDGSSFAILLAHKGKQGTLTSEWTSQILNECKLHPQAQDEPQSNIQNCSATPIKNEYKKTPAMPPKLQNKDSSLLNETTDISTSIHNFFTRIHNENMVCETYPIDRLNDSSSTSSGDSNECTCKNASRQSSSDHKKLVPGVINKTPYCPLVFERTDKSFSSTSKQRRSSPSKRYLNSSKNIIYSSDDNSKNETYLNRFVKHPYENQNMSVSQSRRVNLDHHQRKSFRTRPQLRRDSVDSLTNPLSLRGRKPFDHATTTRQREYYNTAA